MIRFKPLFEEIFTRKQALNIEWMRKKNQELLRLRMDFVKKVLAKYVDIETKPLNILDIGCGAGHNLCLFPENCRRIGVDVEIEEHVELQRDFHLLLGDGTRLPLHDGVIDVALCQMVVEHVPAKLWTTLVAEAHRVLVNNGILIVSYPNYWFPIEGHYKLPFLHWLPHDTRIRYIKIFYKNAQQVCFTDFPKPSVFERILKGKFIFKDITKQLIDSAYFCKRYGNISALVKLLWPIVPSKTAVCIKE